jgi:hypothetical protein
MHRRISSSSRNEQCPSLLPRNMGGTTNQMVDTLAAKVDRGEGN